MNLQYEHLLGRNYIHGRVHCFALVRDFYLDNFGIELGNYAIPLDWNPDELDLIEAIHEQEKFFKVENWAVKDLRPGDILAVAAGSHNPNHLVIYIGGNQLLHHALNQVSTVIPMQDFWRNHTCFLLRHPDVPDLRPALPQSSIQELIDARYRLAPAE